MKSTQEDLQNYWEDVKLHIGFPNLDFPSFTKNQIDTASINMHTKKITIDEDFFEKISRYGSEEEAFKAITAHEANHYMLCPYDLKTLILLDFEATKVNESAGADLANYFEDVIINIDLIERGLEGINKIYYDAGEISSFSETMKALYTNLTGLYFGMKNENLINKNILKKANLIDYYSVDKDSLRFNLRNFVELFSPIYDSSCDKKEHINYNDYSSFEIAQSFKEVIKELSPQEFKDIQKYASQKGILNYSGVQDLSDYYQAITKKYFLKIANKEITNVTEEITLNEWDVDMPSNKVDVFRSNAKFYPGISLGRKSKYLFENEMHEKEDAPDALLLIDSSISMTNPINYRSNAVMAGFIIADFYLKKIKEVAVLNFGCQSLIQEYTCNRKKIYETLLKYQDSYTTIELSDVVALTSQRKMDVYLISDEEIFNYQMLIELFEQNNNIKHVSIIGVDSNLQSCSNKIKRYNLNSDKDFLKFAKTEVRNRNEVYL